MSVVSGLGQGVVLRLVDPIPVAGHPRRGFDSTGSQSSQVGSTSLERAMPVAVKWGCVESLSGMGRRAFR